MDNKDLKREEMLDEDYKAISRMITNDFNAKYERITGSHAEVIETRNITEKDRDKVQKKFDTAGVIKKRILPFLIAGGIGFGGMAVFDKMHDDSKYAPDPNTKTVEEYIDHVDEIKANGGDVNVSEEDYQQYIEDNAESKGGISR